jgi:hypothetical protein
LAENNQESLMSVDQLRPVPSCLCRDPKNHGRMIAEEVITGAGHPKVNAVTNFCRQLSHSR